MDKSFDINPDDFNLDDVDFSKATEAMEKFSKAMTEAAEQFAKAMQPFMEAVVKLSALVYDYLWESYRAVGMPYGDSQEGFDQWFRETVVKEQRRREAEKNLAIQAGLANLRRNGHGKQHAD